MKWWEKLSPPITWGHVWMVDMFTLCQTCSLASTLADDVLEITGAYMCQIVTDLISALDFE